MFDEPFRARFAPASRRTAEWLTRAGVTANHVTIVAATLGVAAAALVASGHPRLAVAVWLAGRLADGLDGAVARAAGTSSSFGGFLDITLDMVAYVAMVLGFAVAYPASSQAWPWILSGYVLVITTTLALSDAAGRDQRQNQRHEPDVSVHPGPHRSRRDHRDVRALGAVPRTAVLADVAVGVGSLRHRRAARRTRRATAQVIRPRGADIDTGTDGIGDGAPKRVSIYGELASGFGRPWFSERAS